jgi:PAS domain S-box-containing protein
MFDTNLLKQLRVLYVEDDEKIRESLASLFEKLFLDVIIAIDGKDGFEKFQSAYASDLNIDVVISDITMPVMDGIEMLKLIKEIDSNVPFVLTTAYSDVHYFKEAIKLNVTHYAIKPINIKQVTLHIQEICAVKFQEKAVEKKQKELEEYLNAIDQVALISKTDTEGIITYANETFCEVSGYKEEELIGHPHSIVRHPEVPTRTFKDLWETISSGRIWKSRLKNLSKNKESYHVNTTIIPIYDKYDDKINEYISIRFLTTQEEEEKRAFKKQVIKNMGDIKKEFNDLKEENQILKDKLKFFDHVDLIQRQLDSEKQRNANFRGQIKHYEVEINKIRKRSDKLITESKERINKIVREKNDYKFKSELLNKRVTQLEDILTQKEEKLQRQDIDLTSKSRKIVNLYDVIDYREQQLSKLGIKIELHKNEES